MIDLQITTQETDPSVLSKCSDAFELVKKYQHVGFVDLVSRDENWSESAKIGKRLRERFNTMVIVGIGGSSLGARAINEICWEISDNHRLEFLDSVDAHYFWDLLRSFEDLNDVCWLFVSKTGSTIETLTCANFVAQHLASKKMDLSNNSVVISEDKQSPLVDWAVQQKIQTVAVPKDIGGRYSVLTAVGMVPAVFLGAVVEDFRGGAIESVANKELVCQLAAQSIQSFADHPITVFWMYSQRMGQFGRWIQQLWAESLGKSLTRNKETAPMASTPMPAIGPADQHSILQQVFEAQRDKFVWFFRVGDAEDYGPVLKGALFEPTRTMVGRGLGELMAAEARATRDSLAEVGVDSLTLSLQNLNPYNLGALFMLMELVVATIAEVSDINAFDQPGVEKGKILAMQYLNR